MVDECYKDRNWLYEHYVTKEMSMNQIGIMCSVNRGTISYWLYKYEIPINRNIRKQSIETRRKRKESLREWYKLHEGSSEGKKTSDITKMRQSISHIGEKPSDIHKLILSKLNRGNGHPQWKNGASFEPYCFKFNLEKREEIRNKYNRVCVVSGVSALQNGQRLCVDHVDENKMQGCDEIPFKLIPLSQKVHGMMNNQQNHLLLELLLYGNKRAELNYGFLSSELLCC